MTRTAFLRTMLFLGLGVLLLGALEMLSRTYPPRAWDGILLARMDTVKRDTGSIRILVAGNSHAGAIDVEELDEPAIPFAFPWQDVAELDHQVRAIAPELPQLQEVFVAVSWFTLHWSNDEADEEILLDSRRTFHAVSSDWQPVEGDLDSLVRGKSYWIARRDAWYQVARGLIRRDPPENELGAHLYEVRSDSFLVAHAEQRVEETLARKRAMLERNPRVAHENLARLTALIDHLRERGVRVVLFTPPYFRRYRELYAEAGAPEQMAAPIRHLARERDVTWLDFSNHPMSEEARWFLDSDHLNADGMRRFTRLLLHELGRG